MLRDRFLRARGYAVANLEWGEWEHACGDMHALVPFLRARLDDAVNDDDAVKGVNGAGSASAQQDVAAEVAGLGATWAGVRGGEVHTGAAAGHRQVPPAHGTTHKAGGGRQQRGRC